MKKFLTLQKLCFHLLVFLQDSAVFNPGYGTMPVEARTNIRWSNIQRALLKVPSDEMVV